MDQGGMGVAEMNSKLDELIWKYATDNKVKAYTEVDMGRDAFTQREMLGFVQQKIL